VEGWLQASQDANDKPVLMLKGQKELKKLAPRIKVKSNASSRS
jgi:hypothetical protein